LNQRIYSALAFSTLLLALTLHAAQKNNSSAIPVDAGTFSVMVNGHRVASESFHIDQVQGVATIYSEMHYADVNNKAEQTSVMELARNGQLKRYTWKEVSPGKSMIVVEPQDQNFLSLKYSENGEDITKAKDVTRPLSPNTIILDDNIFVHIEVLAWRHIATVCKPDGKGTNLCKTEPQPYPVLVPHQQFAAIVKIQLTGQTKLKWKGADHNCKTLKLVTDSGEWTVWLLDDPADSLKMVRVTTPEGLEVLRD